MGQDSLKKYVYNSIHPKEKTCQGHFGNIIPLNYVQIMHQIPSVRTNLLSLA